jgi:RNA polymerase sporulation-specific sigma factor
MLDELNDKDLVRLIQDTRDQEGFETLYKRYQKSIWGIIHGLVRPPIPHEISLEDLHQEGSIGLTKAIEQFDFNRENLFSTFARVCIEREIRSALRKYRSQSYRMLSQARSLDMNVTEDNSLQLIDTIEDRKPEFDPVHMMQVAWAVDQIPLIREKLPDIQWEIYTLSQLGYSYKEISSQLGVTEKDVDNTIQKIRKKLRALFDTL